MNCVNEAKLPLLISGKNQYTLVDFWYSNCNPCIAQFPKLDSLFRKFHSTGFQIVGISTDKKKYEARLREAITKYNLKWPQYWDVDGLEAAKYSINAFPTNFLLDAEKQIIRKNISPAELEAFLNNNLH